MNLLQSYFFFFNRLGLGFHNFVFHGFLGGISDFFKVFKAEHEKRRPLGGGKENPQCHPVVEPGYYNKLGYKVVAYLILFYFFNRFANEYSVK